MAVSGGPPHLADPRRRPLGVAFLVKLSQQHRYFSDLRAYLVEHPALACLLGFDPAKRLPSRKHLGRVLRELPNDCLQFLLDATVRLIADALPPDIRATFGHVVAGDTTAGARRRAPAPPKSDAELYWGYASGVVATKIPDVAEVVLAERTQTLRQGRHHHLPPPHGRHPAPARRPSPLRRLRRGL